MGRKSLDRERPSRRSVSGGKRNRCIIFPANVCITAEALERRNQSWFARTNIPSDLIVRIGENNFHLHKLSMVSRSGYLNRLVFQRRGYEERDSGLNIHIENLPGGIETFELVVKFCYGLTFNLTAVNIAPLYCAAHFLEMIDDLEQGNLISKTEVFLSFVIFSSWKDTIRIFKSCETISSWAKELQLLNQCSESIAWKACTDPQAISIGDNEVLCFNYLTNNTKNSKNKVNTVAESWWFEDVSLLRIDHFVQVINAVKRKGMQSKLVGRCITQWAVKWLSQIHNYRDKVLRVTVESLLRIILPLEEGSISCNFLLHLLKAGLMMNIDLPLLTDLERIIARMLENCGAVDLMVQNYGNDDTVYDVSLVARVVEAYVAYASSNPTLRMFVVGRMVDEYLALVARDVKLSVKRFQLLAEALPENARYCDDHLYRAIDMYLKSHPSLIEEERRSVCRAMEYHKLSKEARSHAMKNDRLPMNITIQFILLEQVNMARSIIADGSNYRRTKSQEIIRVSKEIEKKKIKSQKKLKVMKQEVERLKVQLSDIELCRVELQRQVDVGL